MPPPLKTIIILPDADYDIQIVLPGGRPILVESRPSARRDDYRGSLKVRLPGEHEVSTYRPSSPIGHVTKMDSFVMELPSPWPTSANSGIASALVKESQ